MSFLTVEDFIQMGEMGKRKSLFKKIRKLHSRIVRKTVPKPFRKLDPMYKAPKKSRGGVPVSQDVTSVAPPPPPPPLDALNTMIAPTVTDPSLVAQGSGPGMPQSIPIASAPGAAALPPTGQSAPSPFPTGSSSPYDEDVDFDDETSDDGDTDYGSNSPMSEPADPSADFQSDVDRFVEDQTNSQLNEPEGAKYRGQHDDTIDGYFDPESQVNTQLGMVVPHRAGRNIFRVRMPKYRQADLFDRRTNPHLYRKGRYQGGLVRQGRQSVNPRAIARRKVKIGNASGVSGWLPQDTDSDLKWALAGWGLWAASALIPKSYGKLAKAAGLGAIGIAGVQLLQQLLSPKGGINSTSSQLPKDQTKENTLVSAGFVAPARGGSADRSGFTGGTYKLSFAVTNRGTSTVSVEGYVQVQETPRLVGKSIVKTKSYSDQLKDIKPGDTRTVTDDNFPTDAQFGASDAVATLYLRTAQGTVAQVYGSTYFSIG